MLWTTGMPERGKGLLVVCSRGKGCRQQHQQLWPGPGVLWQGHLVGLGLRRCYGCALGEGRDGVRGKGGWDPAAGWQEARHCS